MGNSISRRGELRLSVMIRTILIATCAVLFALFSAFAETQAPLETESLQIRSNEAVHDFTVEVADDPEEIRIGMMGRESLMRDSGMLFNLGETRRASFWMKNTLIPLDLLFIDDDGQVLAIAKMARPGSLRQIDPGVPVRAVLEINGGQADEMAIRAGDFVVHPLFSDDNAG